jgi:hypothetical protein
MNTKKVVTSQYGAALAMLKQAVVKCPDALWDDVDRKNRFWHVAYHALFYTHLYLSPSEKEFSAWAKHREEYQFMGPLPWPPHKEPEIGEPYSKEEVLEYFDFVRQTVEDTLPTLDLEAAESGFFWLPMGKLELQFYNIRHLQQHTGELCERLGTEAGIDVDWVGLGEAPE